MTIIPKSLDRNQLAKFLPNNESILRFQQLFRQAGETLPADIATINSQIASINAQLIVIGSQISDINSDIADIQAQLEELEFFAMVQSPC